MLDLNSKLEHFNFFNIRMKIKQKIREFLSKNSLTLLSDKTKIDPRQIKLILEDDKHKFQQSTLDVLYDFFDLDKDSFYRDNLKIRYRPTEAVLWNILRGKRIKMWWSLSEVAYMIKWDERQLRRIESWDSLPSYKSYYITQLVKLYRFNPHEEEIIRWFICILSDMIKINNKYDLENVEE